MNRGTINKFINIDFSYFLKRALIKKKRKIIEIMFRVNVTSLLTLIVSMIFSLDFGTLSLQTVTTVTDFIIVRIYNIEGQAPKRPSLKVAALLIRIMLAVIFGISRSIVFSSCNRYDTNFLVIGVCHNSELLSKICKRKGEIERENTS